MAQYLPAGVFTVYIHSPAMTLHFVFSQWTEGTFPQLRWMSFSDHRVCLWAHDRWPFPIRIYTVNIPDVENASVSLFVLPASAYFSVILTAPLSVFEATRVRFDTNRQQNVAVFDFIAFHLFVKKNTKRSNKIKEHSPRSYFCYLDSECLVSVLVFFPCWVSSLFLSDSICYLSWYVAIFFV